MYRAIGTDHVQINTIRVKISKQSQQRPGTAEIEEFSQLDNEQENLKGEGHDEVKPIIVNKVPIGEASSPYKVIQIQTESGLFPVVIIYDTK